MKRKIKKIIITSLFFTVISINKLNAQAAVFDASAFANALIQIYNMYDQINATIESVQNGYEQIKQATERVKSFTDFSKQAFSNWSENDNVLGAAWENIGIARERTRQANGYVSQKVDEANRIKKQFENSAISFNGQDYTLKDLFGFGDKGQTALGLVKDIAGYTIDCWQNAADGYTEGLTYQERQMIWNYYGVSPETYYLEQCAEQFTEGLIEGSLLYTSPNFDDEYYKQQEANVQEILALGDAADAGESEVAHLTVLRETELKTYEAINEFKHDFKRLMAVQAAQEVKDQIERKLAAEEKANNELQKNLERYRLTIPYNHPGF